jgi:hypothetical protein
MKAGPNNKYDITKTLGCEVAEENKFLMRLKIACDLIVNF